MKPENRHIANVHKHLPPRKDGEWHYEKMHNMYRGGTADVWYSGPQDLWVEWKWLAALPKRADTVIVPSLEPAQGRWLKGREQEGRRVAVIAGSPDGSIVFASSQVWEAGVRRDNATLLTKQQVAKWITEQCGLDTSARRRTPQRPSTP
jgi:hypothetical protein